MSNIHLTIEKGETVAIVGKNGSGKSTLVKLLTGTYLPTNSDAVVKIGGVNTKQLKKDGLYKNTSAVFQYFQKYKMTLKDNICISDANKPFFKEDGDRVLKDAEFNEQNIDFDTMLSPEFDGIDLSGGQWQRLAIARSLYRIHNIIVLDEPTSAIDPIEEAKLYYKFSELARYKTAIIVTHRLGATQLADRIIVMDNGKIVEKGTHKQLLANQGYYAKMWTEQSKWYNRELN